MNCDDTFIYWLGGCVLFLGLLVLTARCDFCRRRQRFDDDELFPLKQKEVKRKPETLRVVIFFFFFGLLVTRQATHACDLRECLFPH